MNHNVYLLATDPNNPCRDVIHSRDSDLKVRVFCLDKETFQRDANEIQLFGYGNDSLFAFETVGIESDAALDIVEAIQWYADYIDCPEMEILPDDPRQGDDIAI
ncbi:MAG: hypothetical protein ACXVB0_10190 [Mucilaginibacter sp.]